MRLSRRPYRTKEAQAQDWALALLLSVQPSDRALAGWRLAGQGAFWLRMLAEDQAARQ